MTTDERSRISEGFVEIVGRCRSLREQPVTPSPDWPKIRLCLTEAHDLFKQVLDSFSSVSTHYISLLKQSDGSRDFGKWQLFLSDLWSRISFLRDIHNQLFCQEYSPLIYHHIFVAEMLECLRGKQKETQKFLLLPVGGLTVWELGDWFFKLAPGWFDEKFIQDFDRFKLCSSIICFEVNREHDFERQSILAHEIFHIFAAQRQLKLKFEKLAKDVDVSELLLEADGDPDLLPNRVEELFCDFSAAWFYGPVVLQAFADEVSFYPVQGNEVHPDNDLRAAFLLSTLTAFNKSKGYIALSKYFNLRKEKRFLKGNPAFKKLHAEFEIMLTSEHLNRYLEKDLTEQIVASFRSNIPFVVEDIRLFINNLPTRTDEIGGTRYDDLVSESLRKINLLREIQGFVREPGSLFALPNALHLKDPKTVKT